MNLNQDNHGSKMLTRCGADFTVLLSKISACNCASVCLPFH